MTADEPLKDEDEVTVAAGSDVLAQIREEAQAIKRERTGENADVVDEIVDDLVVWSADADADADGASDAPIDVTTPIAGFDPSLDPTVALPPKTAPAPRVRHTPARRAQPAPAATVAHVHDDGETLIGSTPPPTPSTSFFESSDASITQPAPAAVTPRSRPRVPTWLLLLLGAMVIVGASVLIALLVASGASS